MPQYQIFISYARADGTEAARRIADDLGSRGIGVWYDRSHLEPGSVWTLGIEKAIAECQVCVAVLSHASYLSTICRAEQLRALRLGKRVLPVRIQQDAEIPLHLEVLQCIDFTAEASFEQLVAALEGEQLARLSPRYKSTYVTAPSIHRNSPSVPDKLRDAILSDDVNDRMKLVALYGLDPESLESLAVALCHDPILQDAFPDGILWLEAKPEHQAGLEQIREAGKVLGDELTRYDTFAGAINQFRTSLRSRSVMVLISGATEYSQIRQLVGPSKHSRLIYSARERDLARHADFVYEVPGGARRSRLTLIFVGAVFAATLPAWLWEAATSAVYVSSDQLQREIERQRMNTYNTIGWGFVSLAVLMQMYVLALLRFQKTFGGQGKRHLALAGTLGLAGAIALVFADLRFASQHNAALITVIYPFWAALLFAIVSLWISYRAAGESK